MLVPLRRRMLPLGHAKSTPTPGATRSTAPGPSTSAHEKRAMQSRPSTAPTASTLAQAAGLPAGATTSGRRLSLLAAVASSTPCSSRRRAITS